jgi:hypothetical protein
LPVSGASTAKVDDLGGVAGDRLDIGDRSTKARYP